MSPHTLFTNALLAYCVHEHQLGHVKRIDVWVQPRCFTVQDDGRGMGLDREGYVDTLMGQLAGRPGQVMLQGLGLSIIAASAPQLTVESCRDGALWTQTFAWGLAEAPATSSPAAPRKGTRVTLSVATEAPDFDLAAVQAQVSHWRQIHPGLVIEVH